MAGMFPGRLVKGWLDNVELKQLKSQRDQKYSISHILYMVFLYYL